MLTKWPHLYYLLRGNYYNNPAVIFGHNHSETDPQHEGPDQCSVDATSKYTLMYPTRDWVDISSSSHICMEVSY